MQTQYIHKIVNAHCMGNMTVNSYIITSYKYILVLFHAYAVSAFHTYSFKHSQCQGEYVPFWKVRIFFLENLIREVSTVAFLDLWMVNRRHMTQVTW